MLYRSFPKLYVFKKTLLLPDFDIELLTALFQLLFGSSLRKGVLLRHASVVRLQHKAEREGSLFICFVFLLNSEIPEFFLPKNVILEIRQVLHFVTKKESRGGSHSIFHKLGQEFQTDVCSNF